MDRKILIGTAVVLAALAGGWSMRDSALLRPIAARLGVPSGDATPDPAKTLAAAGVHKCRVGSRIVYADQACPPGSHELQANGGTITVVSFPKPTRGPASGFASGPLVQGMSRDEVDEMREKMIQQAGDR